MRSAVGYAKQSRIWVPQERTVDLCNAKPVPLIRVN